MNIQPQHIIPITELRRNFGEITAKLPQINTLLLTKGGEPFATLKSVPQQRKKFLKKTAGAWKNTELDDDKLWKKILKRRSRKTPIKL